MSDGQDPDAEADAPVEAPDEGVPSPYGDAAWPEVRCDVDAGAFACDGRLGTGVTISFFPPTNPGSWISCDDGKLPSASCAPGWECEVVVVRNLDLAANYIGTCE